MKLDNLTVEIRPRRPWEAVDLGFLMAKRWWLQLTQIWLLVTLPVFILLAFLPREWIWLQVFILWWLKPLFERPLLFILSQTVFGQYPTTREALRAFPRLAVRQWFLSLTWRRLSPSRSLDLPVLQLEGLSRAARSARLAVLHREDTSPATALTIFGVHIESFFSLAIVSVVFIFVPQELQVNWLELYLDQDSRGVSLVLNFFWYIAAALVAPFYVAGGFALYLNRRVRLEAWDVEIAFKRILDRREKRQTPKTDISSRRPGKIVAGLLLVVLIPVAGSEYTQAVTDSETTEVSVSLNPESSRELIKKIKQQDEFNVRKIQKYPDLSWLSSEKEAKQESDLGWLENLRVFLNWISSGGEFLLWILVLTLIFLVAIKYRGWSRAFAEYRVPSFKKKSPSVLFGLEVTRESLPENISDSAKAYWLRGEKRQALSLLYRASLFQLIDRGLELRDGDTEGICLSKTRKFCGSHQTTFSLLVYFESLTQVWQRFAYGHIDPLSEDALSLCEQWNRVWLVGGGHELER